MLISLRTSKNTWQSYWRLSSQVWLMNSLITNWVNRNIVAYVLKRRSCIWKTSKVMLLSTILIAKHHILESSSTSISSLGHKKNLLWSSSRSLSLLRYAPNFWWDLTVCEKWSEINISWVHYLWNWNLTKQNIILVYLEINGVGFWNLKLK